MRKLIPLCIIGGSIQVANAFTETTLNVNEIRYYVPHLEIVSHPMLIGGLTRSNSNRQKSTDWKSMRLWQPSGLLWLFQLKTQASLPITSVPNLLIMPLKMMFTRNISLSVIIPVPKMTVISCINMGSRLLTVDKMRRVSKQQLQRQLFTFQWIPGHSQTFTGPLLPIS